MISFVIRSVISKVDNNNVIVISQVQGMYDIYCTEAQECEAHEG